MKASKQCPKRHSLKVGYLETVTDRGGIDETGIVGFSHQS
jgi:hypothetical protein